MLLRSLPLLALLLACALPVSSVQPDKFAKLVQKFPMVCAKDCRKVCPEDCQKDCKEDCPKTCPKVWKKLTNNNHKEEICKDSSVNEGHQIETGKDTGAQFKLCNIDDGLVMGPESEFELLSRRCEVGGYVVRWLDFKIQWGIFRYSAHPPPENAKTQLIQVGKDKIWVAPGEVRIRTEGKWIKLYGTDAYIRVDRESGATTLLVVEGVAVVGLEGAADGEGVLVEEGHWTYFRPGHPPLPPRPWVSRLGPDIGASQPHFPDDKLLPGPWLLDLSRLDLPKVGSP